MKIGYIGLGRMGGPLARNLIRANQDVLVYARSRESINRTLAVGTSGRAAADINEIAACDVVFTCLPLPADVKKVMLGDNGLLSKMKRDSVYIDVSTIDPGTAAEIETYAKARGIGYIAGPLGKGPAQAENTEEAIFAGGDRVYFDKVLPLLKIVGNPVCYLGGVKQAYAFKLITNMIGMTNLAVLAECFHIAEQAGIDLKQFLELVPETGGNSHQMQVRGPWIANADFANRFGVSLALKDVRLGCEMAEDWGLGANFAKLAKQFYEKAEKEGFGNEDCCAVYKVL